jgi:hypothetical protein
MLLEEDEEEAAHQQEVGQVVDSVQSLSVDQVVVSAKSLATTPLLPMMEGVDSHKAQDHSFCDPVQLCTENKCYDTLYCLHYKNDRKFHEVLHRKDHKHDDHQEGATYLCN